MKQWGFTEKTSKRVITSTTVTAIFSLAVGVCVATVAAKHEESSLVSLAGSAIAVLSPIAVVASSLAISKIVSRIRNVQLITVPPEDEGTRLITP